MNSWPMFSDVRAGGTHTKPRTEHHRAGRRHPPGASSLFLLQFEPLYMAIRLHIQTHLGLFLCLLPTSIARVFRL